MKMISRFKSVIKKLMPHSVVYANITTLPVNQILEGKVVLVTGGSSGFGLAIAKRFISCGAKVVITGRNELKLNAAVEQLGKNAKGIVWDLSDVSIADNKFKEVSQLFGPIDIAINNAGVWTPTPWSKLEEIDWDKVVNTNLKGLFFISKAEALNMINSDNSIKKIINITSIEGIRSGFGPYWASKWGANGLTKGLAKELTSKNVVVNAIAPGMGITDINPDLPKDGNLTLNNLNGRFVTVEEVAELALFLASDSSNSIVGQVIAIDGGMSLN